MLGSHLVFARISNRGDGAAKQLTYLRSDFVPPEGRSIGRISDLVSTETCSDTSTLPLGDARQAVGWLVGLVANGLGEVAAGFGTNCG